MNFTLKLSQRIFLLICIALIGFVVTQFFSVVIFKVFAKEPMIAGRLATVVQDLFMFIVPAIATAMMVTRRPADLLALRGGVPWQSLLLALVTLVVAVPAMNCIIAWNASLHLPASMAGLEQALKDMEEAAAQLVKTMQGSPTLPNLIISILIVGVAAGFSEELFFRGALQRLLTTGGVGQHAAVWIVAVCFSVLHFQFFGFVPRMLLGAYFGYLLVWTRSLWVPICAHSFNNIAYVLAEWIAQRQGLEQSHLDTLGTGSGTEYALAVVSAILTILGLIALSRGSKLNRMISGEK